MPDTKTTKASDPESVNAYMNDLRHPLAELVQKVRTLILAADPGIGEEIKWNAPAFFYTGPMEPFNPKEFRRHLVVFNLHRKDALRLVFWRGDRAGDKTGLLEGTYPDGRRLATVTSERDLVRKKKALHAALKAQLEHIKES